VSRGSGKGRISRDLVAASCTAVLVVYAAGYWRTRDVIRRLEAQAQNGRPGRALPEAPVAEDPEPQAPASPPVDNPVAAVDAPAPEGPLAHPVDPAPPTAAAPTVPAPPVAKAADASKPPPDAVRAEPRPEPAQPADPPAFTSVAPVAPVAAIASPPPAPPATSRVVPAEKWRDGTYTGWGQSYHGDIEARVVIRDGRIVEAGIETCGTRYDCNVIDRLINQPVLRQAAKIDNVSGATESADAYYYGIVEALKLALDTTPPDAAATPP
jgi:uncharacterized protein with FMN-binding domain